MNHLSADDSQKKVLFSMNMQKRLSQNLYSTALIGALKVDRLRFFLLRLICLVYVCLFDLILYVPSTIVQLYRDRSSWVEPELS